MGDFSAWLGLPTKTKAADRDPEPYEFREAGMDFAKGDPRLKGGVTYSNLTQSEREKLDAHRKKNGG